MAFCIVHEWVGSAYGHEILPSFRIIGIKAGFSALIPNYSMRKVDSTLSDEQYPLAERKKSDHVEARFKAALSSRGYASHHYYGGIFP